MDRRIFLRTLVGAGVGLVLPSEVWPFRKIFLPPMRRIWLDWEHPTWIVHPHQYAAIQALELENIHEQIPDLMLAENPFFRHLKRTGAWPGRLSSPGVSFEPSSIEDRPVARVANQVLDFIFKR